MVIRNPYICGALLVGLVACSTDSTTGSENVPPASLPQPRTLSNRPDLVAGGDVLVEVTLPSTATIDKLHVRLGTTDVTSAFAKRADGRVTGLVTGLAV